MKIFKRKKEVKNSLEIFRDLEKNTRIETYSIQELEEKTWRIELICKYKNKSKKLSILTNFHKWFPETKYAKARFLEDRVRIKELNTISPKKQFEWICSRKLTKQIMCNNIKQFGYLLVKHKTKLKRGKKLIDRMNIIK